MNVHECTQCGEAVNIETAIICILCEQVKCTVHFNRMERICDGCYKDDDEFKYFRCTGCHNYEHVDLMKKDKYQWRCIKHCYKCDCRSSVPNCVWCRSIDERHRCFQCKKYQPPYIECDQCSVISCMACFKLHTMDHNPCDICGGERSDLNRCEICYRYWCFCRDCEKCAVCQAQSSLSNCHRCNKLFCTNHIHVQSGLYYCDQCHLKCNYCGAKAMFVFNRLNRRCCLACRDIRNNRCLDCDRTIITKCIDIYDKCNHCHTCELCHDPVRRSDPRPA